MARITLEPGQELVRVFKRRTKDKVKDKLLPVDFIRLLDKKKPDSGISLFKVETIQITAQSVARLDYLHYGMAFAKVKSLEVFGLGITNRADNHPDHACLRCKNCNYDESPAICEPTKNVCPFLATGDLELNEAIRNLFEVKLPAIPQPEFWARIVVSKAAESKIEQIGRDGIRFTDFENEKWEIRFEVQKRALYLFHSDIPIDQGFHVDTYSVIKAFVPAHYKLLAQELSIAKDETHDFRALPTNLQNLARDMSKAMKTRRLMRSGKD